MSEHEHNCGCGCDHDHEEMELETMVLTFDNDEEVECGILGVFEVEGNEYIALLPEGDDAVLLYKYSETEDGDVVLDEIESDEEFDKVSEAFDALCEDEEE